jgi:GAF domain-containing protein
MLQQGFIQNEGIANELAARFYAARGFETIAQTYLRNARHCYLRTTLATSSCWTGEPMVAVGRCPSRAANCG